MASDYDTVRIRLKRYDDLLTFFSSILGKLPMVVSRVLRQEGKWLCDLKQVTKLLRFRFPNLQDKCIELIMFLDGLLAVGDNSW